MQLKFFKKMFHAPLSLAFCQGLACVLPPTILAHGLYLTDRIKPSL